MSHTISVGIDLGTCNSCMAMVVGNNVKIIKTRYGKTTPSIVSFDPIDRNRTVIVGELINKHVYNCIYDAKRFIGKLFNDKIVQKIRGKYPFSIEEYDGQLVFKIQQRRQNAFKTPEDISSEILTYFKECIETEFEDDLIIEAVITVPAYFNVLQKDATMKAAERAGFQVLQLMPEPSAAAAVYCSTVPETELGLCLVFDLGGGTFDISCIDIRHNEINVKFIDGDNFLGGVNFDEEIVKYFTNKFSIEKQIELDNMQLFRLRDVAKYLKENLSTKEYSKKTIFDFLEESSEEWFELTREKFDELNKHWFDKCMYIVKSAFDRNEVDKNEIKRVILVGGSTKIKRIRELLAEFFGEERIYDKLNPDQSVAAGAALNACNLRFNTSFELNEEDKVIPKEMYEKLKINMEDENKDDIISYHKFIVNDVCPMDISVDSSYGYCDTVIEKNWKLPIEIKQDWYTYCNNQKEMEVSIYEGIYKNSKANIHLGNITIPNIPKGKAGKIKITATFKIDKNGLLSVKTIPNSESFEINLKNLSRNNCEPSIDWDMERDREYEKLVLLKKMFYLLLSKLAYEKVISSMPWNDRILQTMDLITTVSQLDRFLQENSGLKSKYINILKEVQKLYSDNSTVEKKRQKWRDIKELK